MTSSVRNGSAAAVIQPGAFDGERNPEITCGGVRSARLSLNTQEPRVLDAFSGAFLYECPCTVARTAGGKVRVSANVLGCPPGSRGTGPGSTR